MTTKQRAALRSMANTMQPILHIGKDGINDNMVKQAWDALEARELIKATVLQNAPMTIPEYDRLRALFAELFEFDQNVFRRNIAILSIIEVLAQHIPSADACVDSLNASEEELKVLISWTHSNFAQKISLDEAAAVVNFSKHYFCKWFKKNTGMNYIQYVKRVRVYNASMLLLAGKTVSEAGYASGFENMSYFIKCFKEIRGCTPKSFVEAVRVHNQ